MLFSIFFIFYAIIYKKDDGKEEEKNTLDEKIISSIFSLYYDAIFCPAESNGKVDKGALFAWIVEFKELLKQQNQTRLFTHFLGRIFAYSPIGEDGYYPHESIRDAIQEYGDQSLENEYVISVFNQRGVFSPTGGVAERELAKKYKAPVYTHNSETKEEVKGCIERYGKTPTAFLDSIGMFEYGGGGFHCVYMTDEDLQICRDKNIWVITNPASNVKLASGIAPVNKCQKGHVFDYLENNTIEFE